MPRSLEDISTAEWLRSLCGDDVADPLGQLLSMPPGSALWTCLPDGHHSEPVPAICARVSPGQAAAMPLKPRLEFRAAAFPGPHAAPVVWLARIEDRPEWTFEAWIDNCADGAPSPLYALAGQEQTALLLFEEARRPARGLTAYNSPDWVSILSALSAYARWPPSAFERAREAICAKYPTPAQLWKALNPA